MELDRILLYSADELCRYVAARLKYRSACYSSSKLQWSVGILRCLNGMDCYLLFPVVSVRLLMVSEHRWHTLAIKTSWKQIGVISPTPVLPTPILPTFHCSVPFHLQGVVIPIGTVVTAATGVKGCFWCRSSGQGQFSNLVTAVKILMFCACILHIVCSQVCAVKRSRSHLWCSQAVKQQKRWSKFFDPGRSCDYSAYRSDHPLTYSCKM